MNKSILLTLIYADLFSFPLKKEEIWQRLIWQAEKRPTKDEFEEVLSLMLTKSQVEQENGFYFLPGKSGLVARRKVSEQKAAFKFKKGKKMLEVLKIIPIVKLVGITGSVAADNAKTEDDIDVLIVSSSGWLWTTRFLTTLFLRLLGVKRSVNEKKTRDKICLNLYMEDGFLTVPKEKQDLFIAHEIFNLKPVWQKGDIYQRFLKANLWVKDFLPNVKFN